MSKVRVASFSVSLDGFGAGPEQSLENPMGAGGMVLHEWAFGTQTFKKMMGREGGSTGVDESFAARGFENVGAWILGRNMFGPIRGPWLDDSWKGWWGDTPPYHVPVFVLTHYERPPLEMKGGTTFYFVTEGIEEAAQLTQLQFERCQLGQGFLLARPMPAEEVEKMLAMAPTGKPTIPTKRSPSTPR